MTTYRKTCSQLGICYFMLLFSTQIFSIVCVSAVGAFAPTLLQADWFIWVSSYVPLYAVGMPMLLLLLRKMPNTVAPEKHTLPPKILLLCFVFCLGIAYFCNAISFGINGILALLKGSPINNPVANAVSNSSFAYNLIIGCILAPVGEEFFFRKWIYRKIGQYGTLAYSLIGGLLFGMMHGNLSQLLYAFVLGAFFCVVYAKTGRIANTIALHIGVNFVGVIGMPLLTQNNVTAMFGMALILALMCAASVLFVLFSHRISYESGTQPLPPHPVRATLCNVGMGSYLLLCSLLILANIFAPT
ncbi:MAG: type II CAAX endopeptidase family protein [Ruthenibacterium sp.]